jgi:predicted permease
MTRSPLFTVITVITLAIGIGGATAVFTVVNSVLLRPLPFPEPERLVSIWYRAPGFNFGRLLPQSPALHFTFVDDATVFEDIGLWSSTQVTVTHIEEPEQVAGVRVTHGTLRLLLLQPQLGRFFTTEDDTPGTQETVVLSHGYWQSRFGGDPSAVGRPLLVDGVPHQIIGVLPTGFTLFDGNPGVFLPFRLDRSQLFFGQFSCLGMARLRHGVSIEQANREVTGLIPAAAERFPPRAEISMLELPRILAAIRPLTVDVVGDVGAVLWILLATVGIVLVIACANVANIFLVRAEGQQQELAIRAAMGASHRQLARALLGESVLFGLLGGVFGLWLAWCGTSFLVALAPKLPRLDEISIDARVVLFTLLVSLLAALLFGLLPVAKVGTARLIGAIKEGGYSGSTGKERHRARNLMVVCQVAMALVLLVGSGLLIRSFLALRSVHPGFARPDEVLTMRVSIPDTMVEDDLRTAHTYEEILQRLAQIPGVTAVGATTSIPMTGTGSVEIVFVEDFPSDNHLPPPRSFKWIAPGYFGALEIPLLAGRDIAWADIHDRAKIAIVSEGFAREHWGDPAVALGKRIKLAPNDPWWEIVGVVGQVHDAGVDREPPVIVYWPAVTEGFWGKELFVVRSLAFAIRSPLAGSESLLASVQQAVWSVNPNLPLANVRTLDEILLRSLARTSFTLVMLGIAAIVALLLGAVGIFGVTSYSVARRTHELGVRMALGAGRVDVSLLVIRQGLCLALVGVAAGIAAAALLTRLMASLLYGVSLVDPLTYAAVALLLTAIALLASYLPARSAARIDPIDALRWE